MEVESFCSWEPNIEDGPEAKLPIHYEYLYAASQCLFTGIEVTRDPGEFFPQSWLVNI